MWSTIAKAVVFISTLAILIKLRKKSRHVVRLGIFCFGLVFLLVLALYPIENLFYSFPSAKELCNYVYTDKNLLGIADGKVSCLIICSDKNTTTSITTMISPKAESGYKIGGMLSEREVLTVFDKGYSFSILCDVTGTDYYIVVQGVSTDSSVTFNDSSGSDFHMVKETFLSNEDEYTSVTAYAKINYYNSSYSIIIEQFGEKAVIKGNVGED